jgi:hypothetical protein
LWGFIEDQNNHDDILINSPTTDVLDGFAQYIRQIYLFNNVRLSSNQVLMVILNTCPFVLPSVLRNRYTTMFNQEFPTLNFQIISKDISDIDSNWISTFDVMFIEFISNFIPNDMENPLVKLFFNKVNWLTKHIFAMPIVDPNVQKAPGMTPFVDDKEIVMTLNKYELLLSAWAKFQYLKPSIPV